MLLHCKLRFHRRPEWLRRSHKYHNLLCYDCRRIEPPDLSLGLCHSFPTRSWFCDDCCASYTYTRRYYRSSLRRSRCYTCRRSNPSPTGNNLPALAASLTSAKDNPRNRFCARVRWRRSVKTGWIFPPRVSILSPRRSVDSVWTWTPAVHHLTRPVSKTNKPRA